MVLGLGCKDIILGIDIFSRGKEGKNILNKWIKMWYVLYKLLRIKWGDYLLNSKIILV